MLQTIPIARFHPRRRMQREPIALRTQRRLHQRERLAAPVPPHSCIALPRAFAQCRTALHRRCREFWQQLPTVARVAGAGRVGFVHPLPDVADGEQA